MNIRFKKKTDFTLLMIQKFYPIFWNFIQVYLSDIWPLFFYNEEDYLQRANKKTPRRECGELIINYI
jgi:hypothetical protein